MRYFAPMAAAFFLVVAVGCGGGSRLLSTQSVEAALREGGFQNVARRSLGHADWIYTRGYTQRNAVEMPIQAVRYATEKEAKRRQVANAPLLNGRLSPSERSLLPRGYVTANLSEERICNVVLVSYDKAGSSAVRRRFANVVDRLRKSC